ncbi:MAG: hypothetical protein NTZ93_04775 [Candidatus Beckwithbacteria bacterium]|nr:hypothetical protein [Candidatus Beckwithbacteria bacterium]
MIILTGGNWSIDSGIKAVILVPNDLIITQNISVAKGGFLAIIASGNIEVEPSVKNLQGVYIADEVIDTGGLTNPLQAEGIFVGWGGINLQRNLTDNSHLPAERFTYRGDLVVNAYRYLLKPHINWQEVAP